MSSPLAIRVRGLRKRFGYREVLRGLDLDIPRGQCFALFGPNGAGKSTLLRILATQWSADAGTVEVLGREARRQALEIRARIGVVLHDSLLRRELSLAENLRFACDLQGLRWREVETRSGRLLRRFGLHLRSRDRVGAFSQGMIRRAGIVRSLLHDPELWLLDEPFSGLDPEGQALLESVIADFTAGGGTVVLVTHRMELGARLAGGQAWLCDGITSPTGAAGTA